MIKKLTIAIGGKDIDLSPEQAKELKKELDEIFRERETITIPSVPVTQPYNPDPLYPPYRPWYPYIVYSLSGSPPDAQMGSFTTSGFCRVENANK